MKRNSLIEEPDSWHDSWCNQGVYIKVHSSSGDTDTSEAVEEVINRVARVLGNGPRGYLARGDVYRYLEKGALRRLLPEKRYGGPLLLMNMSPPLLLDVSWYPPGDPVRRLNPPDVLQLIVTCPFDGEWAGAEQLLVRIVGAAGAHWGELNILEVTGKASFERADDVPAYSVPRFGCANFLAWDHVDRLGGESVLRDAGFATVRRVETGVVVGIMDESTLTPSAFRARQAVVEAKLIKACGEAGEWEEP